MQGRTAGWAVAESLNVSNEVIQEMLLRYAPRLTPSVEELLGIPWLIPGEYRNPFSFLDEFDQWFEFTKRKHLGEKTHDIIKSMLLHDLVRAQRCLDRNFTGLAVSVRTNLGAVVISPKSIIRISA